MSFFNISETIRASDFKIYCKVALDSLYISTENDVSTASQPVLRVVIDIPILILCTHRIVKHRIILT